MVRVNSVGATFMAHNIMSHAKHLEIKNRYMKKYIEDGIIKIILVKSQQHSHKKIRCRAL